MAGSGHGAMSGASPECASNRTPSCWRHITCLRRLSLDDAIALGALAAWGDLRTWLAGLQGPHHSNPGQHGRAAALGDQLATVGQRDRVVKSSLPAAVSQRGARCIHSLVDAAMPSITRGPSHAQEIGIDLA
jgi:hypothetical protein